MTRPVFVDARHDVLAGFIDFAGLLPPASLDLPEAVAEYRAARRGAHAWMLGAFVIPAGRLEDLASLLVATMARDEEPWAISVILDGDPATAAVTAAAFEKEMTPAANAVRTEVRLPEAVADGRGPQAAADAGRPSALVAASISTTVVPFLEVPVATSTRQGVANAVEAIRLLSTSSRRPFGAKLRLGGLTSDVFPNPDLVAAFIVACRDGDLPFKATAGLHHPVRRHDAKLGVMRHGFLNLLVATALAESGADAETIAAVVAEEDGRALRVGTAGLGWRDRHAGADVIKRVRTARFTSYDSSSFDEPIEALEALGILPPAPA